MSYAYATGTALGSSRTGLAIGYRLINADTTVAQTFTTSGVYETSVPGNYTVTNGITMPDGFTGRIEWGTSGTKYAEEFIAPVPVSGTLITVPSGVVKTSPAPTTTAFTVTLTNVGASASLTGQTLEFQSGALQGKSGIILTDTIAGSDHALTFAAWPVAPTAADIAVIL